MFGSARPKKNSLRDRIEKWSQTQNTTKYEFEFQEKLHLLDAMKDYTRRFLERLATSMKVYEASPGNADTKSQGKSANKCQHFYSAQLAEACGTLGALLADSPGISYGTNLSACQDTLVEVAQLERNFMKQVADQVMLPLSEFLKTDLENMIQKRDALYKAKCDMDRARAKLESLRPEDGYAAPTTSDLASLRSETDSVHEKKQKGKLTKKEACELKYKQKRLTHDELMMEVELLCSKLDGFVEHHTTCVLYLMDAQNDFWQKCIAAVNARPLI